VTTTLGDLFAAANCLSKFKIKCNGDHHGTLIVYIDKLKEGS